MLRLQAVAVTAEERYRLAIEDVAKAVDDDVLDPGSSG
jgi:hypothetical protein